MVLRTFLFYGILILQIRLMGKRQLGQMEPSEFVVTILLANLASIPLEDPSHSVWSGLLPMGVILAGEWILSYLSLKSIRIRRFLCGKPVILIENGHLLRENLRRCRINLDELAAHLRRQGILQPDTVQYAILETGGTITVFPYPWFKPAPAKDAGVAVPEQELPYTVVADGRILEDNLMQAGKDLAWLQHYLSGKRISPEQTLLLTVTKGGKTCLIPRDS